MNPCAAARPLFARPDFRAVAGETLRPGGLGLTLRALELAGLPHAARVADLGCGRGATARLLAECGHRVVALDPDPDGLPGVRGRDVLPLRAVAQRLPLAAGCLDAVFCECVLSVTGAAQAVLAECARVLKPGGVLILSDVYLRGEGVCSPGSGCLAGALPAGDIPALLGAAGFAPFLFEDHSRLLAELAGRLVLAGLPLAELGLGRGCVAGGGPELARPGYFLCLARVRA